LDIQWYPGHMKKTKEMLKENIRLVNVVIELLDARVPLSSQNPELKDLLGNKNRVIVLNKYDLAEERHTASWIDFFKGQGYSVVAANSAKGYGIRQLKAILRNFKVPAHKGERPVRAMVAGIPNVGKSSLINAMAGKSVAKIGGIPGVTRGKQWIKILPGIELLDTPGILWPKIESSEMGFHLAVTGAIKYEILNTEELVYKLLEIVISEKPQSLRNRYKLDELPRGAGDLLRDIGRKRGYLLPGGEIDNLKTSEVVLKEFREGLLGRFTLEVPPV